MAVRGPGPLGLRRHGNVILLVAWSSLASAMVWLAATPFAARAFLPSICVVALTPLVARTRLWPWAGAIALAGCFAFAQITTSIQPVGVRFVNTSAVAAIPPDATVGVAAWAPAVLGVALLLATAVLARIGVDRARTSTALTRSAGHGMTAPRPSVVPIREVITEPTAAQRLLGRGEEGMPPAEAEEAQGWIILDRAWIGYGDRAVLREVTLVIPPGELVLVIGPSGVGKTTLLKVVAGSLAPLSGRAIVDGVDLVAPDRHEQPDLGAVLGDDFADDGLIPYLSALENVEQSPTLTRWDVAVRRTLSLRALERVGLAGVARTRAAELSGGQRQLLAIARAMVHEPRILLIDQPAANLDRSAGTPLMRAFHDVVRGGRTIMLTTHDDELIRDHHGMVIDLWEDRVVSYWQEPRFVSRSGR